MRSISFLLFCLFLFIFLPAHIQGSCILDGICDVSNGEVCDDGNNNNTDGCSNQCATTQGWACTAASGVLSICSCCYEPVWNGNPIREMAYYRWLVSARSTQLSICSPCGPGTYYSLSATDAFDRYGIRTCHPTPSGTKHFYNASAGPGLGSLQTFDASVIHSGNSATIYTQCASNEYCSLGTAYPPDTSYTSNTTNTTLIPSGSNLTNSDQYNTVLFYMMMGCVGTLGLCIILFTVSYFTCRTKSEHIMKADLLFTREHRDVGHNQPVIEHRTTWGGFMSIVYVLIFGFFTALQILDYAWNNSLQSNAMASTIGSTFFADLNMQFRFFGNIGPFTQVMSPHVTCNLKQLVASVSLLASTPALSVSMSTVTSPVAMDAHAACLMKVSSSNTTLLTSQYIQVNFPNYYATVNPIDDTIWNNIVLIDWILTVNGAYPPTYAMTTSRLLAQPLFVFRGPIVLQFALSPVAVNNSLTGSNTAGFVVALFRSDSTPVSASAYFSSANDNTQVALELITSSIQQTVLYTAKQSFLIWITSYASIVVGLMGIVRFIMVVGEVVMGWIFGTQSAQAQEAKKKPDQMTLSELEQEEQKHNAEQVMETSKTGEPPNLRTFTGQQKLEVLHMIEIHMKEQLNSFSSLKTAAASGDGGEPQPLQAAPTKLSATERAHLEEKGLLSKKVDKDRVAHGVMGPPKASPFSLDVVVPRATDEKITGSKDPDSAKKQKDLDRMARIRARLEGKKLDGTETMKLSKNASEWRRPLTLAPEEIDTLQSQMQTPDVLSAPEPSAHRDQRTAEDIAERRAEEAHMKLIAMREEQAKAKNMRRMFNEERQKIRDQAKEQLLQRVETMREKNSSEGDSSAGSTKDGKKAFWH